MPSSPLALALAGKGTTCVFDDDDMGDTTEGPDMAPPGEVPQEARRRTGDFGFIRVGNGIEWDYLYDS